MTGEERFEVCRFRSAEMYSELPEGKTCCGMGPKEKGYLCLRFNLENVTPDICAECTDFLPKIDFKNLE